MFSHFKFLLFFGVLFLNLTSCINSNPSESNSGASIITDAQIKSELDDYDIEEIAEAFASVDIPINHLTSSGLLPPNDGKYARHEHIKEILRGLLNGPCVKNSEVIFDRILALIEERINYLSDKLLNEGPDSQNADFLRTRIEYLENLEEEFQNKKDECLSGIVKCTEKFITRTQAAIAQQDRKIADLEEKISKIKGERSKEILNHLLERMRKEKDRLVEILKHC